MKEMIKPYTCRRCGSTQFAIDVLRLGLHEELDVVCRNCDTYQGELVVR